MSTASMQIAERPQRAIDHPLPNLLDLSAQDILAYYRHSQLTDFSRTLARVREEGSTMTSGIALLRQYCAAYPTEGFEARVSVDTVERLFLKMHAHVMSHPVWVHPFFVRIAKGEITVEQLRIFARHYCNQVKNTRQCVALALGRFHTLMDRPEGPLTNALSELTQVVLARLLADEYDMGSVPASDASSPKDASVNIEQLFSPVTHPALFRRFLKALRVAPGDYDVPMLHGVADNVLVQRILASDPAYDELEALASVGLGMEWGVPAFFSMIMAGILKVARREDLDLDAESMEIWSSHVRQDVEHAIAVMIVTSFYVKDEADITRLEGATNLLMAFRYHMMSDVYEAVFGDACPGRLQINLDPRHVLHDRRHESPLLAARVQIRRTAVCDYEGYIAGMRILPMHPSKLDRVFMSGW